MSVQNTDAATDVAAYLDKWVPALQRAVNDGSTFTLTFGFDGDDLALHLTTGFEADRFDVEA